jgi:microcystin-dependent protein
MTLYKWSQTASSDATADPTINWAEGQAPSSINDSARAMMAATAKYRDDIAGAIVTGGTSTAYAVSSFQVFDTVAHLNGQTIAFTPHTTNGATVTLNVDSLGSRPLRTSPGAELQAGTIIQGTPYVAVYNNSDAAFYLQGFYGNPYNVPLLAGMDYWDTITPNSSFIFPAGQAISRTTYAAAFARWGTTYGAGDGSTTFNVPDKTGRASVMKEAVATRLTAAAGGVDGGTMGAAGGTQTQTLTLAQLPTGITSTNPAQPISVTSSLAVATGPLDSRAPASGNTFGIQSFTGSVTTISSSGNSAISVTSNNTSGNAHPIVQPTIVCNYIIRII